MGERKEKEKKERKREREGGREKGWIKNKNYNLSI